ncbi:UDP-glucuronosyltransferase 2A1-like isoform X1 [Alosa sapidissima]|uniref:UDP-glucuronosyltransferase 2A1-like isoform X1 n=1 Tax=Alosa sapidissima TaxID=34773 RepID=UPI001C085506|nr:UDP-glucuronosyltransferase 2A1-like isoform X1 [Alosa sapidissima]
MFISPKAHNCVMTSTIAPLLGLLIVGVCVESGNVLILPGEYSHWHNMRMIVEELAERNHSITVLVNSASPSVKSFHDERVNFKIFQVPLEKHEVHAMWNEFVDVWMYQSRTASMPQMFFKIIAVMNRITAHNYVMCDGVLRNPMLIDALKLDKFEVILFDPMMPCGDVLAETLDIPFILSLRLTFGYVFERQCGQLPTPPSYVPAVPTQFTDHMEFMERLQNVLMYGVHTAIFYLHTKLTTNNYLSEIRGKPTELCDVLGKADIWLIRTYWDFEYPRPLLPNFKFVGGLHCKPAKPLPEDMEFFVQSSGDDGIVVFSLGSMINNLTMERANTIASALGEIPQKVLWRYSGVKPETLAPNTRLYDWLPQNDLLGHPKTKAFITHGGTNGLYEAIYHGVPMVGIPLFADQPDNLHHMKVKGAAVILDFNKLESKDLVAALNTVINDPSYKESIVRLSRIHHDQPMKPLDEAVFWIEFVMRNKGAKHLRVQAHNLSWYQYHSLDVIIFLLTIVGLFIFIVVKSCCFCFRKCFGKSLLKKKTE